MLQTVLDGVDEGEHELEIVFLEDGSWPAELVDAGVRVCVIPAGRLATKLIAGCEPSSGWPRSFAIAVRM